MQPVTPLPPAPVDAVVEAPLQPPVRFRLRIWDRRAARSVVVLEELPGNPGPPVAAVAADVIAWVRERFLGPDVLEPVWVEAWLGRALSALVHDRLPACAYMLLDATTTPPNRRPLPRRELDQLLCDPPG